MGFVQHTYTFPLRFHMKQIKYIYYKWKFEQNLSLSLLINKFQIWCTNKIDSVIDYDVFKILI